MPLNRGRLYQHNECVRVILWGFYAPPAHTHTHHPSTINLICIFCSSNKHSKFIFWLNCHIHSESRSCNYYCKSFFVPFCRKQRCSACAFRRTEKRAVAIINKYTVSKPLCKYLGITFIAARCCQSFKCCCLTVKWRAAIIFFSPKNIFTSKEIATLTFLLSQLPV